MKNHLLSALLGLALPVTAASQVPQVQVPATQTAAQAAAAQRLGRSVTNEEIANAIRQSGLSEDEIRGRLRQAGLDAGMLDPFLSGSPGLPGDAAATADESFSGALTRLGLMSGAGGILPSGQALDGLQGNGVGGTGRQPMAMNLTLPPGRLASGTALDVFGKSLFAMQSSLFDPIVAGPVDPSYRIGAGDELQMVVTGEVQAAYQLEVRRDGSVIVPQVGQVTLAGLTIDAARTLLRQRAARAYSGLNSNRATLDLSVAQIRSISVVVAGEVEAPGSYQVSAVGSVFHALMRAGGPTVLGTFRNIEVRRAGRLLRKLDLYEYLLKGDTPSDLRLEQGDIVFVPLNLFAVGVEGAVRRPGAFELAGSERLPDLLRYSGGLLPTATAERIQIDRLLPPAARRPGVERTVIDIRLQGDLSILDTVTLYDGDVVKAFSIDARRRNVVVLSGEVYQQGMFELAPGMTAQELIDRGQGPRPWGLVDRVQVVRAIQQTGRSESFTIDLGTPAGKQFRLAEFDSVTVFDGRLLYPAGSILVTGAVNTPKSFAYIERQRLTDAIDAAGGFTEDAASVEVAHRRTGEAYSDTLAIIASFALDSNRQLPATAKDYILDRYDVVSVRTSPGFRKTETVVLTGLFQFPGTYTIQHDGEVLSSIIRRAGGILPIAFPESFRLMRNGRPVAVNFDGVMQGRARDDIPVAPDDRIDISTNPSIVNVSGAVERPVSVPFNKGWGIDQYLNAAGGVAEAGDRGRVVVEYASGAIQRSHRVLLFFRDDPSIRPGASITVVAKPASHDGKLGDVIASTFQITATLASMFIAYIAATR